MKVIVVGLGIQGEKRKRIAGDDLVACVDPVKEADFRRLQDVPLDSFDAALVCTPDDPKIEILTYLLENKKHVLVEKPLFAENSANLIKLEQLASQNNVCCYTAYNHRFEPHFAAMREIVASGQLGKVFHVRLFYGNGTARQVRESEWRDQGSGVLPDLGSHLLDTLHYWFDGLDQDFKVTTANRFENRAFDHVIITSQGEKFLELEMSLLSWRNHFTCDVYGDQGSAHIQSLCKWGPSTLTVRDRKLPSGRPDETEHTLVQADPTWQLEYDHFKSLCERGENNLKTDQRINELLTKLSFEALETF